MMKQLFKTIFHRLRDERGSMTLLSTALVVVALLVILPMVWNIGAVRVVRRQSQNGSDAAALAAAESVARQLNAASTDWWGCDPPETPTQIVQRYVSTVVAPIANGGIGGAAASQYASLNGGTLSSYAQHMHMMGADGVHAKLVDGAVVPPAHVNLGTIAPVKGLIAESAYGYKNMLGYPVPARASAEAYLDYYERWETPCPYNPKNAVAHHYRFRWKIRMIKTDW